MQFGRMHFPPVNTGLVLCNFALVSKSLEVWFALVFLLFYEFRLLFHTRVLTY